MSRINLSLRGTDQRVDQVVRFNAESLTARDLDVGTSLVFLAEPVAEFGGTARSHRHHLVREMSVVLGCFTMTQAAQSFDDGVLSLRLACVNHVVDLSHITEVRMIL